MLMQHITGNILCIGLLAENKDRTVMLIVFDKVFADFDCLAEHYRKYARRLRVKSSAVTGFFDAADALCYSDCGLGGYAFRLVQVEYTVNTC